MSDLLDRMLRAACDEKARRDEATIRALLGRWVSELEPAVAYRHGEVIGLTLADAPLGSRPFVLGVDVLR